MAHLMSINLFSQTVRRKPLTYQERFLLDAKMRHPSQVLLAHLNAIWNN